MAIPGETVCREVAPCGSGTWGDIPVEPGATQYVDASYAGGGSDGTAAKPWTKVQDAIDAAGSGDIVAVAAGEYFESLVITNKVRLYGKCPAEVMIFKVAQDASQNGPVVTVFGPKSMGTEIHGVKITTITDHGVDVRASGDVLIDRTWIVDTSFSGMILKKNEGPVTVRASLVESARSAGITMSGSELVIEDSVVRDTELDPIQHNAGVAVDASYGKLTVRSSVIEGNRQSSVYVVGSGATIERSVVRDTVTDQKGENGFGVMVFSDIAAGAPASLSMVSSVVERNRTVGVALFGATGSVVATSIRDTMPDDHGQFGFGFYVSSVEASGASPSAPGSGSLTSSVVERSHAVGAVIVGADGVIESSIVRDTQPSPSGFGGRGVALQHDSLSGQPTSGTIRASLIERSQEMGVSVIGASATIDASLIRDTTPNAEGRFGDGVVVIYRPEAEASAVVTGLRVEGSARAGLSNFGAKVSLGATVLSCSAFDMEGEPYSSRPFAFENLGGNACGCPVATDSCEALSAGIEAPNPVDNPTAPL